MTREEYYLNLKSQILFDEVHYDYLKWCENVDNYSLCLFGEWLDGEMKDIDCEIIGRETIKI